MIKKYFPKLNVPHLKIVDSRLRSNVKTFIWKTNRKIDTKKKCAYVFEYLAVQRVTK